MNDESTEAIESDAGGRPETLVALTSVPSEPLAAPLVAALRERGVRVRAEGGLTSGFRAEAPGETRILVPKSEMGAARAALDEFERAADASAAAGAEPGRRTPIIVIIGLALLGLSALVRLLVEWFL